LGTADAEENLTTTIANMIANWQRNLFSVAQKTSFHFVRRRSKSASQFKRDRLIYFDDKTKSPILAKLNDTPYWFTVIPT
jgi:hypothetical protein